MIKRKFLTRTNQVVMDTAIFIASFFASYVIRFEGILSANYLKQILILFPYLAFARLLSFYFFSIYSIVWRYFSITDVVSIFKACLPVTGLLLLARVFLPVRLSFIRLPFGVIVIEFLLVVLGTLGIRMIRRMAWEFSEKSSFNQKNGPVNMKRTLLVGAGDAGNLVVRELKQRIDLGLEVVGFVDDDPKKFNSCIHGVKVLGNTAQIPQIVQKLNVKEAIISIANSSSRDIRGIMDICEGTGIKVKIIPGLCELLDDRIKISKIREVNIDDLLGRTVVDLGNHLPEVVDHYKNKRIMVTGAGGSIGSELCRQLCQLWPKELILLDKDENSIFEIHAELSQDSREYWYKLNPVIADIRNQKRLEYIFNRCRPEVIFHAAAHKHVPLMECNASEAVMNNVLGTVNVLQLADKYSIGSFIFISSDKAVNPTSVMGATKKLGEIAVQELASSNQVRFSCVRFGNVLGSRGSVVPLFQKQIAQGGPITITHPDVERYFMSISEAVQLIIKAGTLGNQGEIFVLDMGRPIKIIDLARDLIRLSGYAEDEIPIKYIGLRPGEKLYEEILIHEERDGSTCFEKVYMAAPIDIDHNYFAKKLAELLEAARECNETKVIRYLHELNIGYNGKREEFRI